MKPENLKPVKSILITRFNWPHPMWNQKPKEDYQEWLDTRIELFNKYTANSVANCYVKPDYWVVLVGQQQQAVEEKIGSILKRTGTNYVIAPYQGLGLPLTAMLACKDLTYPAKIITSNLDADDLISSNYFAILKSLQFSEKGNTGISFCSGCNFIPDSNIYFHSSYPNNPFLSLYEVCRSPQEAQTVFFRMHTELLDFTRHNIFPRTYYPMWASVLHGGNLSNMSLVETNRISFREIDILGKRFGLSC